MSTGKYVITKDGSEEVELSEEAFLNPNNINSVKFEFSAGDDITESLHKKGSTNRNAVSVEKKGRVGYSSLTCTYDNGETSSKIVLQDCVIQYREGISKTESSNYGTEFICVGIPDSYISKLVKDAKKNSAINIKPKPKVKHLEGCYWCDCSIEKLGPNDCWILYFDPTDNQLTGIAKDIRDILKKSKKNVTADILFTCSGSQTTKTMDDELDLVGGTYYLTFKVTNIHITGVSDTIGPVLDDTNRRAKEGLTKSGKSAASAELLRLAEIQIGE